MQTGTASRDRSRRGTLNSTDGSDITPAPAAQSADHEYAAPTPGRDGPIRVCGATGGQLDPRHARARLAAAEIARAVSRQGARLSGADAHGPPHRRPASAVADVVGAVAGFERL